MPTISTITIIFTIIIAPLFLSNHTALYLRPTFILSQYNLQAATSDTVVPSVDLDELVSGTLAYIESCSDLESVISEWMKWDSLKHKCETMSYVALRKLRAMGISVPIYITGMPGFDVCFFKKKTEKALV